MVSVLEAVVPVLPAGGGQPGVDPVVDPSPGLVEVAIVLTKGGTVREDEVRFFFFFCALVRFLWDFSDERERRFPCDVREDFFVRFSDEEEELDDDEDPATLADEQTTIEEGESVLCYPVKFYTKKETCVLPFSSPLSLISVVFATVSVLGRGM